MSADKGSSCSHSRFNKLAPGEPRYPCQQHLTEAIVAKQVEEIIVGDRPPRSSGLDLYRADTQASETHWTIPWEAVKAWLKGFSTPLAIAIEATNCYHEVLVEAAIAAGHVVYLIDPRKLHHYREATGGRAKTDRQDAILLARLPAA